MTRWAVRIAVVLAGLALCGAGAAWALTADEGLRLKKAGVSDGTIQKMIEQDKKGGAQQGPVTETRDQVIYRAGPTDEEIESRERHERRKEDRALDAMGNVIIDQRRGLPPPRGAGGGSGSGN